MFTYLTEKIKRIICVNIYKKDKGLVSLRGQNTAITIK